MTGAAIAIVIAAVAGTPHCLGMCGALAVAGSGDGGWLPYHSGRILTYAALGGHAGGLGASIPGPGWLPTAVSAVLLVGFAAALAGFLPEPKFALPGVAKAGAVLARRKGPLARLGFGVVNGLLPCGLLYATLSIPVSTGSAASGALLMGLFGLISAVPLTAAVFGLRRLLQGRKARLAMAGLVLVTGLWILADRGAWPTEEPPACHH